MLEEMSMEVNRLGYNRRTDVAEIFCDGKVADRAKMFGMVGGMVADLKTGYNLDEKAVPDQVWRELEEQMPELILLSPECKAFSQLQNLNSWSPNYQETLDRGLRHLRFCIRVAEWQLRSGRLILFEHPWTASSWSVPEVQRLLARFPDVRVHRGDQCAHQKIAGSVWDKVRGEYRHGFVKKPTGWMTNSDEIAEEVAKLCPGDHDHIQLINFTAGSAEE